MWIRSLLCFVALWFAAASAGVLENELVLSARFDHTGEYQQPVAVRPIVASVDDVRVFYASAPSGFTLRENELKIEPGFRHKILGTIRVVWQEGSCVNSGKTKADVVAQLRRAAFDQGANAVIYAESELPDTLGPNGGSCPRSGHDFGSGWAVVVADAEATPGAPGAAGVPNSNVVPAPDPAR